MIAQWDLGTSLQPCCWTVPHRGHLFQCKTNSHISHNSPFASDFTGHCYLQVSLRHQASMIMLKPKALWFVFFQSSASVESNSSLFKSKRAHWWTPPHATVPCSSMCSVLKLTPSFRAASPWHARWHHVMSVKTFKGCVYSCQWACRAEGLSAQRMWK